MSGSGPPADWPERVAPMLAELGDKPFDSTDHLFEIKWDGIRCLARIEPDRLALHNRRGAEIGARYPELRGLSALPPYTLLDGEAVVLEDGKPSFARIMQRHHIGDPRRIEALSRRRPVTLMLFDVLFCAGSPWWRRARPFPASAHPSAPHRTVPSRRRRPLRAWPFAGSKDSFPRHRSK